MSKVNLSNLTNLQSEVAAVTTINNNNTLITQAIENTISRDGTQPNMMNSRLDMNSNQIINLPDAYTDQEPVTYGQYVAGITSVNNGVVVDGAFILAEHDDTTINDRVLVAGTNLQVTDDGPKGNFTVSVSDDELNAIADVVSAADKVPYFTGSGTADVADFTPYARTLVDDVDAETARATLGLVIDTDVQPHDPTLNSLVSAGNGIMTKTAANTITPRTITAPANGISITDGDGVAGNPTLALTNDLAAIEGLATTGIIARTATDTAATRTVTGTANEITVTDGDGVAGNPTISIPNSVTFTGKTVTGGTFSSPTINTPSGITKSDVGLSNVDNTSDATKNAAVATLTNKTLTSPVINSPTGIVKGDVGLGNVDNTSDATKNAASATLTNKTISGSSNTLSDIANASLSSAADSTIKSNISGSAASPSDNTITAVLDKQFGTTQGTIAYRGASSWDALTPGTTGYFLQTQGASADPTWTAVPGGGDLLSTNNLSDVSSADTSRLNLKAAAASTFTKSSNYTIVSSDLGATIRATSGITLSLTAAATLGADYSFDVVNASTGVVTIDPNGSETINGDLTLNIFSGERVTIVCSGSSWSAFGLSPLVLLKSTTLSGGTNVDFISLFDSSFSSFLFVGNSILYGSGNSDVQLVVSTNAGSSWLGGSTDYTRNLIYLDQGGSLSGSSSTAANVSTCIISSGSMSSFEMELFDLNSTTRNKTAQGKQAGSGTGGLRLMLSSAYFNGAGNSVIDGVRFQVPSGIMSGKFSLYGRR